MTAEVTAAIAVFHRLSPGQSPFDDPAVRALFAAARRSDAHGLREIVEALVAELPALGAHAAACAAISCGTLVEWGADPAVGGLAILQRFQAAAAAPPPRDQAAMAMFDQAAMAHLCRSAALRVAARKLPRLIEALASSGETFTSAVLGFVDDLELLVLAPVHARGFRVRLEAVATNAHLFTLLQGALIGEGRLSAEAPDPAVIAVATGEARHEELLTDHQRFRFDSWTGLRTSTSLQPDLGSWIPVEGSPRDIPALADGRRVILLGKPLLGARSWDSNFFANIHDALRSRVIVLEDLAPASLRADLEAILGLIARSAP